jgi:hypothetical protein
MEGLVRHLLSIRGRLPNCAFIACLALAQLNPKPTERISPQALMEAWRDLGCSNQPYVSYLLKELRKHDLVEYEAGTVGDPGYLFWRVGPRPLSTKPTAIKP